MSQQISLAVDENKNPDDDPPTKRIYLTAVQSKTEKQLTALESILNSALFIRDSGLAEDGIEERIKYMRLEVDALKKRLDLQKKNVGYQSKHRKKLQDGSHRDSGLEKKVLIFL